MRTLRRVSHFKYVLKKVPFYMYLVIFSYARHFYPILLSLATTFITVLQNICYDYFPVSQMFYSLFLYEIMNLTLKTFPLEMTEGVRWAKVRTQWGVVARVHVRTMGEGVKIFAIWCVRTN